MKNRCLLAFIFHKGNIFVGIIAKKSAFNVK